jgi:uncharacterized protein (TIGR02466 family)
MQIFLPTPGARISNYMTDKTTPETISKLTGFHYFASPVYIVDKPEFLAPSKEVSTRYLKKRKKEKPDPDLLFPIQTNGFFHEPSLGEFTQYIAQTAWTILNDQGHDMSDLGVFFREMWCQEHSQYQGHDEHIHSHGDQISGFYFLNTPENGCRVAIHDPRPGRCQINLPERDMSKITMASTTALFIPKPGQMFFINSWLPHSITRNPGKSPTRLIHFNLTVRALPSKPSMQTAATAQPAAIII